MSERVAQLQAAMAALQAQRALLGDAVVDTALAPLQAELASLQSAPDGAQRQRRLVTVLFVDMVGSTAIMQGLDEEDTLDTLGRALQQLGDVVQAHGGRVLRFTGDGLKAAFGANEVREDDAERAVHAGLAILAASREQAAALQRSHGIAGYAVRVGLHTGPVVLGEGVEADNNAMGSAVHVAARMEQSAPPGGLRISHSTWSHVRGLFEADEQAPIGMKGVAEPMRSWLVRKALPRHSAAPERGVEGVHTPLVGRDAELQQLLQLVDDTGTAPRALTLIASAGLGKSRLLRELLQRRPGLITLVARAQPGSGLQPWRLLRELLAAQAGIADDDSAALVRDKLLAALGPGLAGDAEQALLIGQLAGLELGADTPRLDPQALRDRAFAAIRSWLQHVAATQPLLLLLEDLHWADDASLDLLQHLVQANAGALRLLMTARPKLLERRADWTARHAVLTLQPLAAEASRTLGHALLQGLGDGAPALRDRVIAQAEGNPYYMEELVRRLIDDGVIVIDNGVWHAVPDRLHNLQLPSTLVGVLQARLDALPPAQRSAAQQASIVGHVFWDQAVAQLDAEAPAALPALEARALVHTQHHSLLADTVQRQFDHHLLHQVTYDTVLKAARRQGHAAMVRWLQARVRSQRAEDLVLLGEHAEQAGETALAIDCFDRAAAATAQRFANRTACDMLARALRLLGDGDALRSVGLLHRLAQLADLRGDRALQAQTLETLLATLPADASPERWARLHFARSMLADRQGDVQRAEALAQEALAAAERGAVDDVAALAQGQLCWLALTHGDQARAEGHLTQGLAHAARARSTTPIPEGQLLTLASHMAILRGDLASARGLLEQVLVIGEGVDRRLQLGALDFLVTVETTLARWDAAEAGAARMLKTACELGSPPRIANALNQRTGVAVAAARWPQALALAQDGLDAAERLGDTRPLGWALLYLANAQGGVGDVDAERATLERALAQFQTLNTPLAHSVAGMLAAAELRGGDRAAAAARVQALLALQADGGTDLLKAEQGLQALWAVWQVLQALRDVRAASLLERLHAEVTRLVQRATPPEDHARLRQAMPLFAGIDAAFAAQHTRA